MNIGLAFIENGEFYPRIKLHTLRYLDSHNRSGTFDTVNDSMLTTIVNQLYLAISAQKSTAVGD